MAFLQRVINTRTMHHRDHGYKRTAPAKHRGMDGDPGLAASSEIWRE
jgi:hypothetical protein